ncbi:MAG: thioredoxin family protein [bacterium]|nr:thioredoxin family protein [bacterium]
MVLTKSFQKLSSGEQAPSFSLQGVDERTYSLSDFKGKEGLLVLFICNHCPYVIAKIDAIGKLCEKWQERIAFVGINSNDPGYEGEGMENMKEFAKERNMQFPYVLDETQETAKAYGATCTPDSFLFDKDLQLVFHGRIDDALEPGQETRESTMDINIERLVSGQEISKEEKYSMGCSIKWITS